MKYKNAIITLGVLIAIILSPFIGLTRSWKEGIAIVLALLVSVLAYASSRSKIKSAVSTSVSNIDVSSESDSPNSQ